MKDIIDLTRNRNVFNKLFTIDYPSINYKNFAFINGELQIIRKNEYINPEQIDICPSYRDESDSQDIFDSMKILYDTKRFEISKDSTKFSQPLENKVFDNDEKDYYNNCNKQEEDSHILNDKISKKKIGRKRKEINKENETEPTNYNVIRKCKNLVLEYTLKFLNQKIKEVYEGNIGEGIYKKELLDINSEQKSDNKINSIINFLNKTLKEIFSVKISERYTSFLLNHNEEIIKRLLNESDINKRERLQKIFNLTFSDCLKLFIEDKNADDSEIVEGFPKFSEIKKGLEENQIYLNKINDFMLKFEDIVKSKKARTRKPSKKGNIKEKVNKKFLIKK